MRDLVWLVQEATVEAEVAGRFQVDETLAQTTVAAARRHYQARLSPKYRRVMQKVAETHRRTDDQECDELLFGNFILSYINQEIWFDAHSILWQE